MSKFSRSVPYSTTFEDNTVTMTLQRLKRKDFLRVSKYFSQAANGNVQMAFETEDEMMDTLSEVVKSRVTDFAGLTDESGASVELETVLEEMYFLPLLQDMVQELMTISNVDKILEKNSE